MPSQLTLLPPTTYKLQAKTGFTLLELIVAMGIFSIVLIIATGLFVSITRSQKRVQSLSKLQGDARFLIENMAQAVRIDGIDYSYYRDPDGDNDPSDAILNVSSSPQSTLVTKSAAGDRTVYWKLPGTNAISVCLQKSTEPFVKCWADSSNSSNFLPVTPTNVNITKFNVYISPGSDPFAIVAKAAIDCKNKNINFVMEIGVCKCDDSLDTIENDSDATNCFPDQACIVSSGPVFEICVAPNSQSRATVVMSSLDPQSQASVTLQTTVSSRMYKR